MFSGKTVFGQQKLPIKIENWSDQLNFVNRDENVWFHGFIKILHLFYIVFMIKLNQSLVY